MIFILQLHSACFWYAAPLYRKIFIGFICLSSTMANPATLGRESLQGTYGMVLCGIPFFLFFLFFFSFFSYWLDSQNKGTLDSVQYRTQSLVFTRTCLYPSFRCWSLLCWFNLVNRRTVFDVFHISKGSLKENHFRPKRLEPIAWPGTCWAKLTAILHEANSIDFLQEIDPCCQFELSCTTKLVLAS